MELIILLILFVISASFHQLSYILIPIFFTFYIIFIKKQKLKFNRITELYTSTFIFIIIFFFLQVFYLESFNVFSLKGVFRYFSYLCFFLMINSFEYKQLNFFFKQVILIFIISFPIAIYQYSINSRFDLFFKHANHLAYVISICIYFLIKYKCFNLIIRYVVFLILLIELFLTKTSGAILILLMILIHLFIFTSQIKLTYKLFSIIGIIIFVIPIVFTFSDKIISQIDSLQYLNWSFLEQRVEDFKPGGYGSFIWRIIYWLKIVFSFFNETNINVLFGVGIDTMTKGNMPYEYMYTDPHNDFLKILVEFGLIGLLFLIYFFYRIYYLLKSIHVIIILFIPMFFDNAIVNFPYNLFFMLLIMYAYKMKII